MLPAPANGAEKRASAPRRSPQLRALAVALLTLLLSLPAALIVIRSWTEPYRPRLATTGADEVVKGLSVIRTALNSPDELLLFGSSELTFQDEYHPARLFQAKPTGFTTVVVGSGYRQSLNNVMALGALGGDLKGKKLVCFLSPTWFEKPIADKAFQKNFSLLQTYETIFSPDLTWALKHRIAERLLSLGAPATDDGLLRAAMQAIVADSPARYHALWPFGRAAISAYRAKDEVQLAQLLSAKSLKPVPAPRPQTIDWKGLDQKAKQEAAVKTTSNRFGIYDDYYLKYVANRIEKVKDSGQGERWLDSSEWEDLRLQLDLLREVEAKPLFISIPVLGPWYDFKGHPSSDRQAYYQQVKSMVEQAGFPVVDLGYGEYEPGFMRDPWHPGWKGGVAIARAIDQYYHDGLSSADH
ncbi:MAG TPA: D-alanyl-lipoteichoic acid biosynthesis protein DltD [Symbiobacteriaceae bacterium]|nr:D-alanyl-lipoteichoic acid biosynthesis protein DltD [Symbiobacteriaceae bacterium]